MQFIFLQHFNFQFHAIVDADKPLFYVKSRINFPQQKRAKILLSAVIISQVP